MIGYGRFQRNEATNGAVALWGIITSAVAVILCLVGVVNFMIGSADQSDEPSVEAEGTGSPAAETSAPAPAPAESAEVNVYDLEVGDCVEVAGGFTVQTVPRSEPHGEEVFAAADLPDGSGDFLAMRRSTCRQKSCALRSSRVSSGCLMRIRCSA